MRYSKSTRLILARMIELLEPRRLLAAIYLDPEFGELGTAAFPSAQIGENAVVVRPLEGGQVLVGGEIDDKTAVVRLNADGSLDTTFGTAGIITGPDLGSLGGVGDGLVQDDGKIVMVGGNGGEFLVVRFNADGSVDTDFGTAGAVTGDFRNEGISFANSVALDGDGNLVLGGENTASIPFQGLVLTMGVARLLSDGTFDTTFDGDGVKSIASHQHGTSVAVQENGRVLLGGYTTSDGTIPSEGVVVRMLADGTLDTSFDGDGTRTFDFGRFFTQIHSILPLSGGQIVVGGMTRDDVDGEGIIQRLNADGSLDTSFAQGGTYTIEGESAAAEQLRLDGSNRIVGVTGGIQEGFFVRLNADGSPDTELGNGVDGLLRLGSPFGKALSLVDDDTILIANRGFTVTSLVPRPAQNFSSGVLFLTGGDGNDTVSMVVNGSDLDVTHNGSPTTYTLADVEAVDLELHGGDDNVTLDALLEAMLRADLGEGANSLTAQSMLDLDIRSGSGADTIMFARVGNSPTDFGDSFIVTGGGDDTVSVGAQDFRLTIDGGDGNDLLSVGDGPGVILGGAGDDSMTAGDGNNGLRGDEGDDTIFAGDGNDQIDGGDGADSIDAGAGDDNVMTGDGLNSVQGGAGFDTIIGGADADSLLGGDGGDTIGAGHGANTVFAGAGDDSVRGGDDNDWFWGESGYDTIKGGFGDDFLHGGNGKDRLFGQQGNDRLYGSGNDDALDGGPGMDLMVAGDRNDKLWAEDGEEDTVDGGAGVDQAGIDLLDHQIDLETILS